MRIRARGWTINKLLITSLLLALMQGVAHTTYAGDAETSWDLPTSRAHVAHGETRTTQEPPLRPCPGPIAGANLERAFWICDYAATTRGVSATPVEKCGAVYEQLKTTRFEGDFNQLLLWWRENKPTEHQKIAREDRGGAVMEPVDQP